MPLRKHLTLFILIKKYNIKREERFAFSQGGTKNGKLQINSV